MHRRRLAAAVWIMLWSMFSLCTVRADDERRRYRHDIENTAEEVGDPAADEVVRKLSQRALPDAAKPRGMSRFGVHGMELPFMKSGRDPEKMARCYELLARCGVQSFRTAEAVWHRLGPNFDKFSELDYQVASASKYGMTLLLTLGYPVEEYSVVNSYHSTFKPEHEELFRKYLRAAITRTRGHTEIAELANEVDAPEVWWQGGNAEMYVRDIRILEEEVHKIDSTIKIAAFAATYSRNEQLGGEKGGRRFVGRCFELGIDQYVDLYTLHYTWPLQERDFPAYFHRMLTQVGSSKPLANTEETGCGRPSDVVKLFCRDLLLYGMTRVDYFLARDFYENGSLVYTGLFDLEWKPKLRLLAYAAAVDAIGDRRLLGIAEPSAGVEAYVLQAEDRNDYTVVMWRNDPSVKESILPASPGLHIMPVPVGGLKAVRAIRSWRMDDIALKDGGTVSVGDSPVVVFADAAPDWKLISPQQWLAGHQVGE